MGMLNSSIVISWGWQCKSQKAGSFHRQDRFSLCNTAALWNFIASLSGYILQKIYWIPLFTILLLFYVFKVGKAKSATQSVLMILAMNELFQKSFNVFYFTPKKYISLILHPFPLCLFFSIIVFLLWFLTATILLIQAPLPIQSHKNTLLWLKIHIWMEFFWNQKFIFFHKRNFNPKFIN